MTTTTSAKHALTVPADRDAWSSAGIWVVGVAAAALSWTGWWLLAIMCGWNRILAAVLPLSVDVYVITSARVWLRLGWVREETRRFAAASTMLAVLFSVAANAAYHLMDSRGITRAPWPVVVAVSGLAPLMLALVAHLQARLNADRAAAAQEAERARAAAEERVAAAAERARSRKPKTPRARPASPPRRKAPVSAPGDGAVSAPEAAPEMGPDVDTEMQALNILRAEPGISGSELGRRLGVDPAHGRYLRRKLAERAPAGQD